MLIFQWDMERFTRRPGKLLRLQEIHNLEIEELRTGERNFYYHNNPINRVRVFGTVTSKYSAPTRTGKKYATISLDDGSDTIRVKAWGEVEKLLNVNEGDIVDVLGRVRYYNDEFYIQFEEVSTDLGIDFEIKMRAELLDRDISIAGEIKNEEQVRSYVSVTEYTPPATNTDDEEAHDESSQDLETIDEPVAPQTSSKATTTDPAKMKQQVLDAFHSDSDQNTAKRISRDLGINESEVAEILKELQEEVEIISYGDGKYEKIDF